MSEAIPIGDVSRPSNAKFTAALVLLVGGFFLPALVPFVVASDLGATWKAILSGALLLGLPELCFVIGVAILGKPGFQVLKSKIFALLRRTAPADAVGPVRYRIGLVMFCIPILFAWVTPYLEHAGVDVGAPLVCGVVGDVLFVASFFVLGGDFWDKVRALFIHGATAKFPEPVT